MSRYQKSLVFLSCVNAGLAVLRGKSAWFAVVPLIFGLFVALSEVSDRAVERHLKSRYDAGWRPWGLHFYSATNRERTEAAYDQMANGKGSIIGRDFLYAVVFFMQVAAAFG